MLMIDTSQVERAEAIVQDLQSVMSDKDSRIATLSKQVKAAEEQVLLEQNQRQNAQQQVPQARSALDPGGAKAPDPS
jgi:hypothetical protein